MKNIITVSWFSAGVSSAVATWLMRDEIDRIIYQHIDDQHDDTLRFVEDISKWIGKKIEVIQSPYKSVEGACMGMSYINSANGAACTRLLKRRLRQEWESANEWFARFNYVWGMDIDEKDRVSGLHSSMPRADHVCPLVDNQITKEEAHGILAKHGIKRPKMYDMGYSNNNCVGCVKGGKGYWNKIRKDFPDVFASRAIMERKIGATCLKKKRTDPTQPAGPDNTVKFYLDELEEGAGKEEGVIIPECGAMCELVTKQKEEI